MPDLPAEHRALVLSTVSEPPTVKVVSTPTAGVGSAVVRILCANVLPYASEVYGGKRGYPMPMPLVIGSSAIARIAAVGPDATSLKIGDMVMVDIVVAGRDNPNDRILFGAHSGWTPGSATLMNGEWRDATYAEYTKVPLENCTKVPDNITYPPEDLAYLHRLLVPFGGLRDLAVKAGQTIIVAPATGGFGGACVELALAMGARVVAAGRNATSLERLSRGLGNVAGGRLRTVQLSGDVKRDTEALGPADAWIDWSPPGAGKSPHLEACLTALKVNGKASLMGGITGKIEIPYVLVMSRNLTIKGRFMFEPEARKELLDMVECGILKLGNNKVETFPLEEWEKAFESAASQLSWGEQTLLRP